MPPSLQPCPNASAPGLLASAVGDASGVSTLDKAGHRSITCDTVIIDSSPPIVQSPTKHVLTRPDMTTHADIDDDVFPDHISALKRRIDWTPPPCDTVAQINTEIISNGMEIQSSPSDPIFTRPNNVFTTLRDTFQFNMEEAPSQKKMDSCGKQFTFAKRAEIEMIATTDTLFPEDNRPTKMKDVKKRLRTITELAVAAYAESPSNRDQNEDKIVPSGKIATKKSKNISEAAAEAERTVVCNPGYPVSKARKRPPTKKLGKAAKKTKKPNQPRRNLLLSPLSAMRESSTQDFVFGTSSQLAREESPTFLRDLQAVIQSSNRVETDIFAGAATVDLSSVPMPQPKLWGVASRGEGGRLASESIIDLDEDTDFPEDPADVVLRERQVAIEANKSTEELPEPAPRDSCHSPFNASKRDPLTEGDGVCDKNNEKDSFEPTDPSIASPDISALPDFQKQSTSQLAMQVSQYGYKPIRDRKAMIALLSQCWSASHIIGPGGFGQPARISTSAAASSTIAGQRPRRPPQRTPKKKSEPIKRQQSPGVVTRTTSDSAVERASTTRRLESRTGPRSPTKETHGMPAGQVVFEIEDSESDGRLSSSESPISSCSSDVSDEPGNSPELSLAATPNSGESNLFQHITEAVMTSSHSLNTETPSWYEKMLMYDTIILEEITEWLNSGQLLRVGYNGDVSSFEVKKWCESKSVCCTWKSNLHGKERKL